VRERWDWGVVACCKAEMNGLGFGIAGLAWREPLFSSVRKGFGSLSQGVFVVIDEAEVGSAPSSLLGLKPIVAIGITRELWIAFLDTTSEAGSALCGFSVRLLVRDLRESGQFMIGREDVIEEWSDDGIEECIESGMDDCTEDAMEDWVELRLL